MVMKNKKELIYNSWRKLFKKYSPKRVSIDMIVLDAWVWKGTFYLYYKNKAALYENIVNDIINVCKEYITNLVNIFPNPKERLMIDLLNSLDFFCDSDSILWHLMCEDRDFYLGEINWIFLQKCHNEMIWILFSDMIWNIFNNEDDLLKFSSELFVFYHQANWMKLKYKNQEDFRNFMTKMAYFFVEWLFSEYFWNIKDIKYSNYIDSLSTIKWKLDFIK